MTDFIQVRDLGKRFRGVTALEKVNVAVHTPGLVGLVGKNGAGKTTFLALLAGALRPSTGSIEIFGRPAGDPALLGKIGVLMQDAAFKRGIPVYEQLLHFGRLSSNDRAGSRRELDRLLAELEADEFARKKPEILSYGQRKRLGIVQALLGDPALLLLDEPTAGLDPAAAMAIRDVVRLRAHTAAIILSSHNLYEIEDICTRVMVIDKGRMINDSEISGLSGDSNTLTLKLDRGLDAAMEQLLSALPEVTEVKADDAAPGKIVIHVASADVNRVQLQVQGLLVENGYGILGLTRGKTLADGVFQLMEDT